jgi:hypothetical protein
MFFCLCLLSLCDALSKSTQGGLRAPSPTSCTAAAAARYGLDQPAADGDSHGYRRADCRRGRVTSVDLTDDFITAPVRTIAGQQDAALRLLEQSPAGRTRSSSGT